MTVHRALAGAKRPRPASGPLSPVEQLRAAGRTVAVTGDGANDAPAIRLAHVGMALGAHATAAAREAADIVITDDRIETIVDALLEGRAMWASVRDAITICSAATSARFCSPSARAWSPGATSSTPGN